MSERGAFFVFFTGLLVTMLGVGGVENSITDGELASAVLVSAVGLLIMWTGTLALKVLDNR